jgi:signal transduction histidine kinase
MTDEDQPTTRSESSYGDQESSPEELDTNSTSRGHTVLRQLVPDYVRQKLLSKILLGLVIGILISGGLGFYTYQGISQSLEDDVETQIRATTTLHENAYDNWFSERRAEVKSIVETTTLEGTGYGRISIDLDAVRAESEYISQLYLIERDSGEVLASSDLSANGQNITAIGLDTEYLQQRSFVYPGQYESRSGYPALAFGIDASDQNNVDRLLIAEINATNADLSRGEDPTIQQTIEGATTSVLTSDGKHVIGAEVSGEMPPGITNTVTIKTADEQIKAYQVLSSEPQFVVVTQTPRKEAFALRNAVLQNFGLTLAVTFFILAGITVLSSRVLSRDLNVLVDRLHAVGSGNLDVDLSTDRIDEIGVVYKEFDTMRRSLQTRIEEVRQSREELEQYNEQINVLDRMLRHNLNNQLNVVNLYAAQIKENTSDDSSRAATRILETCDAILTRVDKQRKITKMLSGDINRGSLDVVRLCEDSVSLLSEQYPEVQFDLDIPESAPAMTTHAIENAFIEVIENAILHNEKDTKRVEITVSQTNGWVIIDVIDNGPGIPEIERNIFENDTDIDPLNHSQGIGLWLVYWTVELSEGEFRFVETEGTGTHVRILLPEPRGTDSASQG